MINEVDCVPLNAIYHLSRAMLHSEFLESTNPLRTLHLFSLSLKHRMLQFNTELIFRNIPHLLL
jgi:hypothetical protein